MWQLILEHAEQIHDQIELQLREHNLCGLPNTLDTHASNLECNAENAAKGANQQGNNSLAETPVLRSWLCLCPRDL